MKYLLRYAMVALAFLALVDSRAQVVKLEPFGRAVTVQAEINGQRGTFLFDTGAGITNVTPEFATKLNCKVWGKVTGFTMQAQRIDMQRCDNVVVGLGGQRFTRETVGVFDINSMFPPNTPHVDGTIAIDVLDGQAFSLSMAKGTVRVLTAADRKKLKVADGIPVHLARDADGMALGVNLPVKTSAGTAWFEMDSGNASPFTLIDKRLASLFSLKDEKSPQDARLVVGKDAQWSGKAGVLDLTLDGNLGVMFLKQYDVTVDLSGSGRAWLQPTSAQ